MHPEGQMVVPAPPPDQSFRGATGDVLDVGVQELIDVARVCFLDKASLKRLRIRCAAEKGHATGKSGKAMCVAHSGRVVQFTIGM
jgi:hypothetical protein